MPLSLFCTVPVCPGNNYLVDWIRYELLGVMMQVIGSHQLGPEAKEKALKRREKVAATEHKSSASERAEAQQQKRFEKQQEQMVCSEQTFMSPSQLFWSTMHVLCICCKLMSMRDQHWPQS